MFEFQSALFQGDQLLQAIADDVRGPGGGLTRISKAQNRNDPAVLKVQTALLDWRADSLPEHGADGEYGSESAAAVHRFKAEELGVPEPEIIDDVGPLTVQRLDAIRAAAEKPATQAATLTLANQYGEPLANVGVAADDGTAVARTNTDEQGQASLAVNGPAQVTVDGPSVLAALGDLLDRPGAGIDPGQATVVTPAGAVPARLGPGERLDLIVAARVDVLVDLLAPLEGTLRVEGHGVRPTVEEGTVRLALQATGQPAASVLLDPEIGGGSPVGLPPIEPWVPPDGYIVQPGDTESDLAVRFFDDPSAFAELSDHPPAAGETLKLPAEAVPGWVAVVAEPLPDPPVPKAWLTVAPEAILAVVHETADPAPLHDLIVALQAPPAAGDDPVAVASARAEAIFAFLALGPGAGVADVQPVDSEPEWTGLDELTG